MLAQAATLSPGASVVQTYRADAATVAAAATGTTDSWGTLPSWNATCVEQGGVHGTEGTFEIGWAEKVMGRTQPFDRMGGQRAEARH